MADDISKLDDCAEISEDLSAFIDGELSKEQLAKIYEHLIECRCCRQAYEDMKITQKAIKNYFKRSTEEFEIPEKSLNSAKAGQKVYAEITSWKKRLIGSWIFTIPVAIIMIAMRFFELMFLSEQMLILILLVLGFPVIFFFGWQTIKSGLRGFASFYFSMDSLIALGTLIAYLTGLNGQTLPKFCSFISFSNGPTTSSVF